MEPPPLQQPPHGPPPIHQSPNRDNEHLRVIAILNYVFGGFCLLGIFLIIAQYYFVMRSLMDDLENMFIWFYILYGAVMLIAGTINILSGIFIQKRKNRILSFVAACLNCIFIPLGTVLGVFTIVTLTRDTVIANYNKQP